MASCLALLTVCGFAGAEIVQENTVPEQRVLLADYGIYTAAVSDTLPVAADIALTKKTYRVPLQPGVLFGMRFVLLSKAGELPVGVRISYPAPPLSVPAGDKAGQGNTGRTAIQSYTRIRTLQPKQLYFEGLRIADDPLFVPGVYRFELLRADKVLLSRTFELFPAEQPAAEPPETAG